MYMLLNDNIIVISNITLYDELLLQKIPYINNTFKYNEKIMKYSFIY